MPSMESWPCYSIEILKSNLYKILCIYFCKICLYKHVYIVKESLKRHIFINTQAYPRKNKTVNPKEINSEYSLERLMLKIQCFGHLMRRANTLEKSLMLRKTDGRRRGPTEKDGWMAWRNGHESEHTLGDNEGAWHAAVRGVAKNQTRRRNWATAT